jgi:DNA-binding NarL/FixJ family response regulator
LGYLLKNTPAKQLAESIRSLYQGYGQLGPTIAPKVFSQITSSSPKPNYEHILSVREIEVLKLVAQGKTNREIAVLLYITEGTVKNHITHILGQLGLNSRTQAAIWAQQNIASGTN